MTVSLFALFLALAPQHDGCNSCEHRGVEDCDRHSKEELAWEAEVLFCSEAARCEDCGGALVVDCPRCAEGPESDALETRLRRIRHWTEVGCEPERLLQRPLVRVETAHFEVVIAADELKYGSKHWSAHRVAHALAREAEAAALLLDEHFGAEPTDYSGKTRLWYFGEAEDHFRVNREIFGRNVEAAMKFYGPRPASSAWTGDKGLEDEVMAVVMNGVHVGVHLLLSSLFRPEWLQDKKAGWFDVGAAHYYEIERFRRTATYCLDEANTDLDWKQGKWRAPIRSLLARRRDPILPDLLQELPGTLWEEEHALSFSLFDYVVHVHPEALKPLLLGFKRGGQARDLIREHLHTSVPALEESWRKWVAETYPTRDPKPRKKL